MKRIENEQFQEKLDFLGLNMQKIPKFITDSSVPSFNISRLNNDRDLRVYKFVPIDQIEILLTPCLRSDNIKKKYAEALPLKSFLIQNGDETEEMLYQTFLAILGQVNKQEIEKVEKMQESFGRKRTI